MQWLKTPWAPPWRWYRDKNAANLQDILDHSARQLEGEVAFEFSSRGLKVVYFSIFGIIGVLFVFLLYLLKSAN